VLRLAQSPSRWPPALRGATLRSGPALSIRVVGNHFVNQDGETVRLLG